MLNSKILDTMLIKNSKIFLKVFHEQRTFECFRSLGLELTPVAVAAAYQEIENLHSQFENRILRVIFARQLPLCFEIEIKAALPVPTPVKLCGVRVDDLKAASRFKWQDRSNWNRWLQQKIPAADDIVTINENDDLIETSRHNLFLFDESNDIVKTPDLLSGGLDGVYRRFVMSAGEIELPGLGRKKVISTRIPVLEINNYRLFVANSVREVLGAEFISG